HQQHHRPGLIHQSRRRHPHHLQPRIYHLHRFHHHHRRHACHPRRLLPRNFGRSPHLQRRRHSNSFIPRLFHLAPHHHRRRRRHDFRHNPDVHRRRLHNLRWQPHRFLRHH